MSKAKKFQDLGDPVGAQQIADWIERLETCP